MAIALMLAASFHPQLIANAPQPKSARPADGGGASASRRGSQPGPGDETAQTSSKLLTLSLTAAGDRDSDVVTRLLFRFAIPADVPAGTPLVIQGSLLQKGVVIRNFRYPLPEGGDSIAAIQVVPAGEVMVEARLMIPLEDSSPVILAKVEQTFTIAKSGKPYVANEAEGADAIVAEAVVPETSGAVRILPPRRDVAPNLFVVEVATQAPVRRVEFWVEEKKILARNAPPYRAELDLGKLPKRVEVRAIGYDAQGHYVDADAFLVNERETPLETKITRTVTPDGVAHFKLSVQNTKGEKLESVVLFAGKKKIQEWKAPPYAVDIPEARLTGVEFVRASVVTASGYEASDLLYLNGERYTEEVEVNLVELPVSVTDQAGSPVTDLQQNDFTVTENGRPQKIATFSYASSLPLSLGVLVDHSGSMKPRMEATRAAAIEFFHGIIKRGDRAFIGGFSFDTTRLAPFVADAGSLEQQVAAIPEASGGTSLYDAIVTGLYRFRSVEGRKALVILTDGEDTTSRVSYEEMLSYVRSARVPVYFIGIGLGFTDVSGTSKMKALATETGGAAYFIRDVKRLRDTYRQLENDLRTQYLVSYYTQSVKKDATYRPVDVKVNRPDVRVRTIRGFIP